MKVFISWSGDRSRSLAQGLREWLPLVLHYVEPWLSEADIEAGERWAQSVAKELAASNFGIICVTSENITSPWVLFEAGALTKSLETSRVIPLLLDLEFSDVSGPLAQFQAKKLARPGVGEVIQSIQKNAEQPIPEARAKQLFEALWPEFEKKLEAIPDDAPAERHMRLQHEILEELVASVRALDARIRDVEEAGPFSPRRRGRRMHPMMFREFHHMVGERPDDPIMILVMASMFRDELPWLYELGADAYRAVRSRHPDAASALHRFRRAAKNLMRGAPFMEEFGMDPMMMDMTLHEVERFCERLAPADEEEDKGDDEPKQ
ncbi:MAG: toll/interleukin-1 receptor domain-containing protein [Bryobacterales bacterium]|nr:toll/interleukin-1 receptor domain-containing protein [Bryobacterales bacterium]